MWAELHAEGWSIKSIAEKTGFSPDTVSKHLRGIGMEEEKQAEKPQIKPRGVGGRYAEFKTRQELDDQKIALKVTLDGYVDELQGLGDTYGAEKLRERTVFLNSLIGEVETLGDVRDCWKILVELGEELELTKSVNKLKDDVEKTLGDLRAWQDYFRREGLAWNTEPQELMLEWLLEQVDHCRDIRDIAGFRDFLSEKASEIESLVERGKRQLEMIRKRRAAEAEHERRERSPHLIQQYLPIDVPRELLTCVVVGTESQAMIVARAIYNYWHGKRELQGRERRKAIDWFVSRARSSGLNFVHILDRIQNLQQAPMLRGDFQAITNHPGFRSE
jgi:lambda repressor-like predicted transcriptional regulator